MDLHDFDIVAQSYDIYVETLYQGDMKKRVTDFHLGLAQSEGKGGILDIGCGTGSIAIPLAESGLRVFAFDISEAMIRRFRAKIDGLAPSIRDRIAASVQSMVDFRYDRSFSLAMIPRSGFMHLLTAEDQRRALTNINRHLEAAGVLTLNTFDPNIPYIANHCRTPGDFEKRTAFVSDSGDVVEIFNATSFEPEHQLLKGVWRFESEDGSGATPRQECPLRMRYTFRQEMYYLLELTGFQVEELYGSYEGGRPVYPSPLVWVARKVRDV